ncbi:MAG: hypothetical protein ACPLKQ_02650 [Candidatus Bathyarchaeales archaeon]
MLCWLNKLPGPPKTTVSIVFQFPRIFFPSPLKELYARFTATFLLGLSISLAMLIAAVKFQRIDEDPIGCTKKKSSGEAATIGLY